MFKFLITKYYLIDLYYGLYSNGGNEISLFQGAMVKSTILKKKKFVKSYILLNIVKKKQYNLRTLYYSLYHKKYITLFPETKIQELNI